MPTILTFKQAAAQLGLRSPRVLSDSFYDGTLPDSVCFWLGSRRCILESELPTIKSRLRTAGRLRRNSDSE
jgi:hypothetical protein